MTLPAIDSWAVRGLKGPEYKVGPRCSNPNCRKLAAHAHHIVRRSALGGDYAWIEVAGWTVANKTGVCADCHDDLTGKVGGHKAAIRIDLEEKSFSWNLVSAKNGSVSYRPVGLLDPQPPTPDALTDVPGHEPGSDSCPFCGQRRRRRPREQRAVGRRRRKTWTVKVPADAREEGADVLDAMVENLAPLVPNADSSAEGRYFVLVPALAYCLMNPENFVETMEGVGG